MNRMETTAVRTEEKPKYGKTAAELLERCRAFFADPENEREYQKWKEEQKKKGA